jgi:Domain of unknown function (DUF929)
VNHRPTPVRSTTRRKRTRLMLLGGGAAIVIVALVVAVLTSGESAAPATTVAPSEAAAAVAAVTSVDAATLDAVGAGADGGAATAVSGTPLAIDGKPEVLYLGAEFCPFCAAQRWPLIVALSRFGTFDGLNVSRSSSTDVHPNTPTFTFFGSTYRSDALAFTAVETATNEPDGKGGYTPLQTPTAEQIAVVQELNPQGGIPFIDFAGRFAISGASFDPSVMEGMSANDVAAALADPQSTVARNVLGRANMITATLCELTGNQPAAVCSSAAVRAVTAP